MKTFIAELDVCRDLLAKVSRTKCFKKTCQDMSRLLSCFPRHMKNGPGHVFDNLEVLNLPYIPYVDRIGCGVSGEHDHILLAGYRTFIVHSRKRNFSKVYMCLIRNVSNQRCVFLFEQRHFCTLEQDIKSLCLKKVFLLVQGSTSCLKHRYLCLNTKPTPISCAEDQLCDFWG